MSMSSSMAKEPLPPLESTELSLLGKASAVRQFPSGCGRNVVIAIKKYQEATQEPKVTNLPNGQPRVVAVFASNNRPAITARRRDSGSHRAAFQQSHRAGAIASPGNRRPRTARFPNNHHSRATTEFIRTARLQSIHRPRAISFFRPGLFDFSDSYQPRATAFPRAIVSPNSQCEHNYHRREFAITEDSQDSRVVGLLDRQITKPSSKVDALLVKQTSELSTSQGNNQSSPNTQLRTSQKLINKDAKFGLAKTKPVPKKLKKQVNISKEKEERPVKKNDELINNKFVCSNLSSSFGKDARRIAGKCQPRHQVKDKGVTIQTIDPPALVLNAGCQPNAEAIILKFPYDKILEETKENWEAKEESQFEDVKFSPEEQDVEVIVVDSSSEEVKVQEAQFQNLTYMELEADRTEDVDVIGLDSSNEEVKLQEAQALQGAIVPFKVVAEAESFPLMVVSGSEPGSQQTIEKTRRKRKEENNFEIVPLKRGKYDFLVPNSDLEMVPIDSGPRQRVMETLSTFRSIYNMTLQQDSLMQANQLAYKLFKERNDGRHGIQRFVGIVPGVEIGDEFRLRVEMFVIGLHCQHQAGIDYIKAHGKEIAVSIVSSCGRYAHNRSNPDVLLYSGSGVAHRDQKLQRGNLALKNSVDAKNPVRVIHGTHKYQGNKRSKTYVYDGLYLAEKCWFLQGKDGHWVIMFRLRRITGQPEISIHGTQWSSVQRSSAHLATVDISNGEEDMPINAVNTVDGDPPMRFKYVSKIIPPPSYTPAPPKGCGCTDGCWDTKKCACVVRNGGKLWFNDSGEIMKARPLVYECGPRCRCPPSCRNRVTQHGIKIQLEIFKTQSTGWGVRSRTLISSGSFVCEYAGEVLTDEEAQNRPNDEYLFAIGNNYRRARPIPDLREASFAVDASEFGNVGRFINHSCSPNLYAQNVLYDHDDIRMPHIMLFASVDIQPFTELTYDYNYRVGQVYDCNGNVKKKECHCGSQECTGLLY